MSGKALEAVRQTVTCACVYARVCVRVCVDRCPNWSDDEQLCVRSVNNELHFYENNDFGESNLILATRGRSNS